MRSAPIVIRHVTKRFQREREAYLALDDVSLDVAEGEIIAIVGSSGCGKTTLLNVIAGLVPASQGTVRIGERTVVGPGRDRGVVFQQDALFFWRTVQQNVEYGLEVQGLPKAERRARAMDWLRLVGLSRFAAFWPKELSGGMKKRCQIAIVLANDPDVLLMDEPFGALDYSTKCELQAELLKLLDQQPKTVFFVTHDIEEAAFIADRVVVMERGRIASIHMVDFKRPRRDALRLSESFAAVRQTLSNAIKPQRGLAEPAGSLEHH